MFLGPLLALTFAAQGASDAPSIVEVEEVGAARRVAVRDLDVVGLNPRLSRVATDALVDELRKYRRVSVIGMDEVRLLLEAEIERQLVGCDDEGACLAEVAEALGADVLVTGSVARVGEETVVALRRLNQQTAVGRAATRRVKARDGAEVLEVLGETVAELFADRALREGEKVGVDVTVVQRLNPPPLDPWVTWTGLGLGVAAGLTAGGAALVNRSAFEAHQAQSGEVRQAQLNDQAEFINLTGAVAVGAGIGSAAILSVSAVAALLTDWEGLRATVE